MKMNINNVLKLSFRKFSLRSHFIRNSWILPVTFTSFSILALFALSEVASAGRDATPSRLDSASIQSIHQRADHIFEIDSKDPSHRIPSGRLFALSMALEFHNYSGAEQIVDQLEAFSNASH